MALNSEQTYLMAKYLFMSFTVLTIIGTFVGYGVVVKEMNRLSEDKPNESKYWHSWRAFIIVHLVFQDLLSIVGLFGGFKENLRIILSYGIVMSVLWIFNFVNYAILETNVFNYLMSLGAIITAFHFAKRIRDRQLLIAAATTSPTIPRPIMPEPAVIQVQPSYIPNQSSGSSTIQYISGSDPQSTPPPPYLNATQPKLEFKY